MQSEQVTEIIRLARVAPDLVALSLSPDAELHCPPGVWARVFFVLKRQNMALQRAMHYQRHGVWEGGIARIDDVHPAWMRMMIARPDLFSVPEGYDWRFVGQDSLAELEDQCFK